MEAERERSNNENMNKLNLKKQSMANPSFSFQNTVNLHHLNLPSHTTPSVSGANDVDEYLQGEMRNSIL